MTDAQIAAYYAALLAEYGPTYRAGDYGSLESQKVRFGVLAEGIDDAVRPLSVLDAGCGIGDFRAFVPTGIVYTGWDFSAPHIEYAKTTPGGTFEVRDLMKSTETDAFDYVVASGLFQFRGLTYIKKAVTRMFQLSRQGIGFNVLTGETLEEEIINDPYTIGRWCRQTLGRVIVRADYKQNDATIHVFKN